MQPRPRVFQRDVAGAEHDVAARYRLSGDGRIAFEVAAYDRARPLVIDPVLAYSTFLGGAGDDYPLGLGIAVDSVGNAYITGQTTSGNFPTTAGAYQVASPGVRDVFLAKIKADGTGLVYSTYLGGSGSDIGYAVAVDASDDVYVAGSTASTDFPVTAGAFQTAGAGLRDGFVAKIKPDGAGLVYSTRVGGSGDDDAEALAIDKAGNAYVAGLSVSANFPRAGVYQLAYGGSIDAFITKIRPDGKGLVYSTFLGGSDYDEAHGVAVDASGNAYVVGLTRSANFPTTAGAYQIAKNGAASQQAFVTKIRADATGFVYSTYLGGGASETARAVTTDTSGNAYVAGETSSADFPTTTGAYETVLAGRGDAFVTKIRPRGGARLLDASRRKRLRVRVGWRSTPAETSTSRVPRIRRRSRWSTPTNPSTAGAPTRSLRS